MPLPLKSLTLAAALVGLWLPLQFAHAAPAHDFAGLERWFNSEFPRGDGFSVRNALPKGTRIKFCAGAGCKIKISYTFTEVQLQDAERAMANARRATGCTEDTAACERQALRYGVRSLDQSVRAAKLSRMSFDEVIKESINRDNNNSPENFADLLSMRQHFLRDCVDQATNGSSYLLVLSTRGLMKHHRVIAPAMINLGLQPHFFTRIEEKGGRVYRFDLYRSPRTDFEKLPGVIAM